MNILEKAVGIATEIHAGQYRLDGREYIEHPLRVMKLAEVFGYSVLTQCVAVLHDTAEDAPTNEIGFTSEEVFEYLGLEGFTDEITIPLRCLTKDVNKIYTPNVYMQDYIIGQIAPNPRARAVKKFDLLDNLDFNNLLHPSQKHKRREDLYWEALTYLGRLHQPTC